MSLPKLISSNVTLVAVLAGVVLAIAFWAMALSPKREEVAKLDKQVEQVEASLSQHQAEIAAGEDARKDFADEYQRLVVLGKAVPGDDDTASLLVQVNHIADRAGVRFSNMTLAAQGGAEASVEEVAPAAAEGESVSPTEAAAATMPLGATIGPAGLAVMPYTLNFDGSFFRIADFVKGLDSLVATQRQQVAVEGRLLTVNGFSLQEAPKAGFPNLEATFSVTTYLTPPGEGVTAGASPESPEAAEAAPVAATTGGGVAR